VRTLWAIPSLSVVLLISGCLNAPLVTTNQNTSNQNQGTAFSGKVHGGQQAVTGASVYLYAAGTSGYAGPGIAPTASNASVSLLKSAANTSQDGSGNYYVTTDSGGNFSITGDYTCPANAQVYLYSIGGNPGMGAGNNSAAGFLAALGPCSSLTSSTFVFVDEVSTITTAFALAGFTTDATHISSSNGAQALMGIKNAFATVANLENLSTGFALSTTPAGNGTFDISGVNVMADILAACVNSTGPTSTQCSTLFTNTMNGSTAPTDTAMAAINIAHNPSANVSTLFTLKTANSPFQPTWYRSGNSFSIVISYTGGGIQEDQGVAIDASGNVWVGNSQNNSLTEVSPLGVVMTPAAGLKGGGVVDPFGIAIDTAGNVWVNDAYPAGLSEYNPKTSTWVTSSAITGGGENFPEGIAIDPAGNLWIANEGNDSLSEYNPSTGWVSATGYTGGGLNMPHAIAVDLQFERLQHQPVLHCHRCAQHEFADHRRRLAAGNWRRRRCPGLPVDVQLQQQAQRIRSRERMGFDHRIYHGPVLEYIPRCRRRGPGMGRERTGSDLRLHLFRRRTAGIYSAGGRLPQRSSRNCHRSIGQPLGCKRKRQRRQFV